MKFLFLLPLLRHTRGTVFSSILVPWFGRTGHVPPLSVLSFLSLCSGEPDIWSISGANIYKECLYHSLLDFGQLGIIWSQA